VGTPVIAALRLIGGGITLAVVSVLTEGRWRRPTRPAWPWVALGAVGVAAYQFTFFLGTERTGVAVGTVVAIGSAPVAGGILAALVDHQPPSRTWSAGTALAIAGMAALTLRDGSVDLDPIGLAAAAGAGTSYAVYALAAGRLVRAGCPSSRAMSHVFLTAGLALAPIIAFDGLGWLRGPGPLAIVAHLSIVTIGLSYVSFGRGVGSLPLGLTMTITLVEPAVATLLGVTVLGEHLGAVGTVGLAGVLAGVAVASRPGRVTTGEP
jgi:DME family drug/metabolite transporter